MTHTTLAWAIAQLAAGNQVAIATVLSASGSVPGKPGARLVLSGNGEKCGTVGGAGLELQVLDRLAELLQSLDGNSGGNVETFQLQTKAKGQAGTPLNSLCGGLLTIAFEVIQPMPHILLCGGGHCAKAIADACDLLDWKYSVFDVRSDYSDPELYPNAEGLHNSSAKNFLAGKSAAELATYSDILLLGHEWEVDEELLNGFLLAQQEAPDIWRSRIGVIGSKSKWKAFVKAAIASGIEPRFLDSVDCPIGLNVGAETPPEIAIAVVGQLLARIKSQDPDEATWRQS